MEKQQTRTEFSRQPARALLVDLTPPFPAGLCSNIYQALEELFAIVCNQHGPCRVPFFSLYTIGTHHERLFPLQPMKGSFPRLCNALRELKSYHATGFGNAAANYNCCLAQALKEMNSEFKRQTPHIRQAMGFPAQLEVTIVTSQQPNKISSLLEQITKEMDLDTLRKIQVVSMLGVGNTSLSYQQLETQASDDKTASPRNTIPAASQSSSSTDDPLTFGLVDVICLEADFLSIQDFFKGWLHDCGTDSEHIHLLLPSKDENAAEGITLKCDLHERILDPASFPFQAQFGLQNCGNVLRKSPSNAVPVMKLRAIQVVKADGICDSLVRHLKPNSYFGIPLLVRATSCWKLDWEELEFHQQHFHALCHLLQKENLVMIARLESSNMHTMQHPSSNQVAPPNGHFMLMPAYSLTLLIKPIACNELMLPGAQGDFQAGLENPLSDYVDGMQVSLKQLQTTDIYNPLLTHCGLRESLHNLLVKTPWK
ncbi:meiosis 1 arrest protein-like [Amphiura filiformis]|uniref:meiosis 1 arrest protein-like n=1 Tax=Amphiura filiformis TaxID=82378 RepID=UPI003B215700